jgi:hypothetical protein
MSCAIEHALHQHLMEEERQDAISEEADNIWRNLDRHELLEMLTDADAYEKVVASLCHWLTCPNDVKPRAINELVDVVYESIEDDLRRQAEKNLES